MNFGLDFGNLFSSVAIILNERSEVVADSGGHRQLPSIITYHDSKPYIGVEAQKIMPRFPKSTLFDLKSLSGLSYEEAVKANKELKTPWDFHQSMTESKKNGGLAFQFQFDKEMVVSSQDVLLLILQQLKKTAEDSSGQKAVKIVITIPFHHTPELKSFISDTSKRIGWNDVHFISDPAAVLLAYELDESEEDVQVVIVDFGTDLRVTHASILRGNIIINKCLSYNDVNSRALEGLVV